LEANVTAAYFEDHPIDPDKVILRKPRLDQGPDYERGFIDGMMYQTETTVNKAVDAMSKRTWVGLTYEDMTKLQKDLYDAKGESVLPTTFAMAVEAKLKEKNT
jgi:hypothetical protein